MKILFFCRSFHQMAGGVERMSITLMNEMVSRGHRVELITWDRADAVPFYALDKNIVWHRVSSADPTQVAGLRGRLARARAVWRIARNFRPDMAIGFQYGSFIAAWLYMLGLRIPVICAERNAPSRHEFLAEGKRRNLVFQSMRLAHKITIQVDDYRAGYPAYLHPKIVTIPNPVFPVTTFADPQGNTGGRKTLLSVGRLSYQKNMPALISAFAKIAAQVPDWDLAIVGDGEDRNQIEAQLRQLNLGDRVRLLGAVGAGLSDLYTSAQLFTLASRWEGFPNALAEALAHGLPAVAYTDCAGMSALIAPHKNGLLAAGNGDVDTLAASLLILMNNDTMRMEYGMTARLITQKYAPAHIFDLWEKVLTSHGN